MKINPDGNIIRRKLLMTIMTSAVLLLSIAISFAQNNKTQQSKQYSNPNSGGGGGGTSTSTLVVSPDEDYLIGLSDVISVTVQDDTTYSKERCRVNAKGMIEIGGLVGEVVAYKKTPEEVAKAIADKLRGGYLTNPIVTVVVREVNSRAFFIQGAVHNPGIYQIEGTPSLLKLITIAGGLNENYGSTAYIIREKKGNGELSLLKEVKDKTATETSTTPEVTDDNTPNTNSEKSAEPAKDVDKGEGYEIIKANINNMLKGNFDQNIKINAGDIVHIPVTDIFFVAGEVKAPGSFTLKEGTTLRQAISLAQGTNYEGDLEKGIIFREDQNTGKRNELAINIKEIMSGKQGDIDILPNDIIIVPNSQKKTIVKGVLKGLSGGLPGLILRGLGF